MRPSTEERPHGRDDQSEVGQAGRLIDEVAAFLTVQDFIDFALLFGSYADGKETPLSDIDLGIHLCRAVDLLTLGRVTAELERITRRSVDILVLNDSLKRDPGKAYRVVASGKLIACKDRSAYVNFKTQAILRYLDTAYLREMKAKAFLERVRSNRLGEKGHARTP